MEAEKRKGCMYATMVYIIIFIAVLIWAMNYS